jgi:hypothetical protein
MVAADRHCGSADVAAPSGPGSRSHQNGGRGSTRSGSRIRRCRARVSRLAPVSPTCTDCGNVKFDTQTVTTRPPACGVADIFAAEAIGASHRRCPPSDGSRRASPGCARSAHLSARSNSAASLWNASLDLRAADIDSILRRNMKWSISLKILNFFLLQRANSKPPNDLTRYFHGAKVKGLTIMVNSQYNGWRFEDLWLDK